MAVLAELLPDHVIAAHLSEVGVDPASLVLNDFRLALREAARPQAYETTIPYVDHAYPCIAVVLADDEEDVDVGEAADALATRLATALAAAASGEEIEELTGTLAIEGGTVILFKTLPAADEDWRKPVLLEFA